MPNITITQEVREVNITIEQSGQSYTLQPVLVVGGAGGGGKFIPITGTEVGSPVTGDIEFGNETNIFSGITNFQADNDGFNSDGFRKFADLKEVFLGINTIENLINFYEFIDSNNYNFFSLSSWINRQNGITTHQIDFSDENSVRIISNNSNFKGLRGALSFISNYDDESYVQKKYVDDKVKIGTTDYQTLTGAVSINVATLADDTYFLLSGNTTITWTNVPDVPTGIVKSFIIRSTTAETLTLPVADISKGTFANDGSENQITIKFSNFATEGLKIVQSIMSA